MIEVNHEEFVGRATPCHEEHVKFLSDVYLNYTSVMSFQFGLDYPLHDLRIESAVEPDTVVNARHSNIRPHDGNSAERIVPEALENNLHIRLGIVQIRQLSLGVYLIVVKVLVPHVQDGKLVTEAFFVEMHLVDIHHPKLSRLDLPANLDLELLSLRALNVQVLVKLFVAYEQEVVLNRHYVRNVLSLQPGNDLLVLVSIVVDCQNVVLVAIAHCHFLEVFSNLHLHSVI